MDYQLIDYDFLALFGGLLFGMGMFFIMCIASSSSNGWRVFSIVMFILFSFSSIMLVRVRENDSKELKIRIENNIESDVKMLSYETCRRNIYMQNDKKETCYKKICNQSCKREFRYIVGILFLESQKSFSCLCKSYFQKKRGDPITVKKNWRIYLKKDYCQFKEEKNEKQ
jgi:hypothetical protein